MKVAFFSNASGKNGVTSNLACISVMCALEYHLKCTIIENHRNINNIESVFVRYQEQFLVKEDYYYFNHIGMDTLIKKLHSNKKDVKMIESAAIKFLNGYIHYIPQCNNIHKSVLEFQLNEVITSLLDKLEECSDITFIDMEANDNLTSQVILEKADLVVVNLSQNSMILKHFFDHYQSLIPKSIFLISKYDSHSIHNVKNIMRKFHIPKDIITFIPYNVELKDSLSEGRVIEFISRNLHCKENDTNYLLMKALKHASSVIVNKMNQEFKEVASE